MTKKERAVKTYRVIQWATAQHHQYTAWVDGDPPTELTLRGAANSDGSHTHPGYTWTAMAAVNVIPAVCDAAPGVLTHLGLGVVRRSGLAR